MILSTILLTAFASAVIGVNTRGSYAPDKVPCPENASFIRDAADLSSMEKEWITKRHERTDQELKRFLEGVGLEDFDAGEFIDSLERSINIGLSFSGGSYRAMFNGAGQFAALDSRTEGAEAHGLGGLLQASTYLSGLSGGNWLTGTLIMNNWSSVPDLLDSDEIWNLENPKLHFGGDNLTLIQERWKLLKSQVDEKAEAGFHTSLTDPWGRQMSYQFFGTGDDGAISLRFSDMRDIDAFKDAEMPFPFSIALSGYPDSKNVSLESTVIEFNPFEMGSWDPSLFAFTDLKYLGSNVSNGVPVSDICIEGFDNVGFVLGTSSNVFNEFPLNTSRWGNLTPQAIHNFLGDNFDEYYDVGVYKPNPFRESEHGSQRSLLDDDGLYLVDGGWDLQNIPLAPMLLPERGVDVLFAFDNSFDTEDTFPNGTAIGATYDRQFLEQGQRLPFPYVPSSKTILKHELNSKPLFLGCNASNMTDLSSVPPLVVYIPNVAYTTWSNTSGYKVAYSNEERNALIQNGFEAATRFNLTIDPNWKKCVGCSIIRRSQERNGIEQSEECSKCFQEYCWNGEEYTGDDVVLNWSLNYTSSSNLDTANMSSGVYPSTFDDLGLSSASSHETSSTSLPPSTEPSTTPSPTVDITLESGAGSSFVSSITFMTMIGVLFPLLCIGWGMS